MNRDNLIRAIAATELSVLDHYGEAEAEIAAERLADLKAEAGRFTARDERVYSGPRAGVHRRAGGVGR